MNSIRSLAAAAAFVAGVFALSLPSAFAAEVPEDYPLTTCVVSDEPLGSMGDAERYVHREEGKPDRVVYFCCGGCEEDFAQNPAHFLAKLDAARDAQAGSQAKAKAPAPSREQAKPHAHGH